MTDRSLPSTEEVLLVVLYLGMATFVVVHSLSLYEGGGEQTLSMVRQAWFVGFAVVAVLLGFTWTLG